MIHLLLIALLSAQASAPINESPTYTCAHTDHPPVIDGRIDDAAWSEAKWTDDFVALGGRDRPAPRHRTRCKMIWDTENLYIAAELAEPDIRAKMRRHDDLLYMENAFEVFLDPASDGRNYAELEFNALNTSLDLLMDKPYSEGGKADLSWTLTGMKSAVHLNGTLNHPDDHDQSWTIEIAVPWKSLAGISRQKLPPAAGSKMRIELARSQHDAGRRAVYSAWSATGPSSLHVPERWGTVLFVSNDGKTARHE